MMDLGVCYFPEQWDESTVEPAVAAMANAGLEYVRMGEFAWGKMEPQRGSFDLAWLDETLEHLGEYGLQAVLCTPTAAPPKWLFDDRPSIRRQRIDGTPEGFGSRRAYCFNSPAYHEETDRIVDHLAAHYADHDVVVGWQIDNEYGCHETIRCYCPDCADAFRAWLRNRYADIDALNEAWGTAFWSQQYSSFDAVDLPEPTPSAHHPSLLLDYHRFASASAVTYNQRQARILEAANDEWFLTHNVIGGFETLDVHSLGDTVDFLAWDSYPTGFVQTRSEEAATPDKLRAGDPDELALYHAICRDAAPAPFWVMEQQPGDINWSPRNPQPGDGAMRLWALHAAAHGADAVCYFRWRAGTHGQEQYHSGLRDHAGRPDRGYHDAAAAARDLAAVPTLEQPSADVALLHDYESLWALAEHPHAPEFDYWSHLRTYFDVLRAHGVTVDIRHPDESLDPYDAVVAPTLYLVDQDRAAHLEAYVRDGGHLLCTIRTGFKDASNRVHTTPRPGPLRSLMGATVDQHETLPESIETVVSYDTVDYKYRTWGEWLTPTTAAVRGRHRSGVAAGKTAITTADAGDGTATYVGVWPEQPLAERLCVDLLDAAAVPHRDAPLPAGVRLQQRGGYCFCANFTGDQVRIDGVDTPVLGSMPLGPYDLLVVEGDATELGVSTTVQEC